MTIKIVITTLSRNIIKLVILNKKENYTKIICNEYIFRVKEKNIYNSIFFNCIVYINTVFWKAQF